MPIYRKYSISYNRKEQDKNYTLYIDSIEQIGNLHTVTKNAFYLTGPRRKNLLYGAIKLYLNAVDLVKVHIIRICSQ